MLIEVSLTIISGSPRRKSSSYIAYDYIRIFLQNGIYTTFIYLIKYIIKFYYFFFPWEDFLFKFFKNLQKKDIRPINTHT